MSRRGSCGENNFGAVSRRINPSNDPQNVFLWPGDKVLRPCPEPPRVDDSCVVTLCCEWSYAPGTDAMDNGAGVLLPALPPVVPLPFDDMRPMFALLSIGCGGITRMRECDVGMGFIVRTPASALKLDIVYPVLSGEFEIVTQPPLIFWTWIGCGAVPSPGAFAPQRRTIHYGFIDGDGETVFPIPPGALAAIPFSSGPSAAILQQRLGPTAASGVVAAQAYTAAGALQTDAMVLVQGATHMGVVSKAEGGDVYGVIYLLTL